MKQEPREAAEGNENWFGDLLPQQQAEADYGDRGGRQVGDRLAGEHDDRAGDRPGGGCGGALDKGLDLRVVAVPDEPPPRDGDAEVDRSEDRYRSDDGAGQSGDEVANERRGDHDRPGREQAHGNRIDELAAGEPVMLNDDAFAEERDDGQAAAEDEGPGLEEEQSQRGQNTR